MNAKRVRLLHIEDDPIQRRVVAHYLQSNPDYQFEITGAADEETALAEFERSRADCVLLDYHLSAGDGMSCLRRIRGCDARVPVIAISGVATPEIAANLLREGADDYLDKQGLRRETLTSSIVTALARHRAWQRSSQRPPARLRMLVKRMSHLVRALDPALVGLAASLAEVAALSRLDDQEIADLLKEAGGDTLMPSIQVRLLCGMVRELLRPGTKDRPFNGDN
ncbi:MAG: response regulator [Gemmataceae bacterium]